MAQMETSKVKSASGQDKEVKLKDLKDKQGPKKEDVQTWKVDDNHLKRQEGAGDVKLIGTEAGKTAVWEDDSRIDESKSTQVETSELSGERMKKVDLDKVEEDDVRESVIEPAVCDKVKEYLDHDVDSENALFFSTLFFGGKIFLSTQRLSPSPPSSTGRWYIQCHCGLLESHLSSSLPTIRTAILSSTNRSHETNTAIRSSHRLSTTMTLRPRNLRAVVFVWMQSRSVTSGRTGSC